MSNLLIHIAASVGGAAGGFIGAWLAVRTARKGPSFLATEAVAQSQAR